ncbi:MAG: hypothetical protein ACJAXB_001480 [Candidatus Endobugula sp.]|jgi:hypothetical protein
MSRVLITILSLILLSFSIRGQVTLELNLDKETARPGIVGKGVFQVIDKRIYYLNRISNNIKVFDLKSGNTLTTITLLKAGPNAVGPEVETFYVLNKDSIFVFSQFFNSKLSLINSNGLVIKQYNTWPKDIKSEYDGGMLSARIGGIKVLRSYIYLAHMIYDLPTRQVYSPFTQIDMNTGYVSFLDYVPNTQDFIDITKLPTLPGYLSQTIEVNNNSNLIINNPLLNEIFSVNPILNRVESHKAKSDRMMPIKVLSKSLNNISREQYEKERRDISVLTGYYPTIIYDKFEDKYFRIVRLPYDEEVLKRFRQGVSNKLPPFSYSVIALDKNFNIIDEWVDIKGEFQPESGAFVDERGLWLLERKEEDEDKMIFHKINFKK